jgi:hypothetical protein
MALKKISEDAIRQLIREELMNNEGFLDWFKDSKPKYDEMPFPAPIDNEVVSPSHTKFFAEKTSESVKENTWSVYSKSQIFGGKPIGQILELETGKKLIYTMPNGELKQLNIANIIKGLEIMTKDFEEYDDEMNLNKF